MTMSGLWPTQTLMLCSSASTSADQKHWTVSSRRWESGETTEEIRQEGHEPGGGSNDTSAGEWLTLSSLVSHLQVSPLSWKWPWGHRVCLSAFPVSLAVERVVNADSGLWKAQWLAVQTIVSVGKVPGESSRVHQGVLSSQAG